MRPRRAAPPVARSWNWSALTSFFLQTAWNIPAHVYAEDYNEMIDVFQIKKRKRKTLQLPMPQSRNVQLVGIAR